MTTAIQIINSAYVKAGIKAYDQILSDDHKSQGLDLLNDMLGIWNEEGIRLDMPTLTINATVYADKNDMLAIKYNLAVLVREHYRYAPDVAVIKRAGDLYETLLSKYEDTEEMDLPAAITPRYSTTYDITE